MKVCKANPTFPAFLPVHNVMLSKMGKVCGNLLSTAKKMLVKISFFV